LKEVAFGRNGGFRNPEPFTAVNAPNDTPAADSGRIQTDARMSKITAYLEDVSKEMRKVSWPTQQELIRNTVITLVATVIVSLFIFGADRVISMVLEVVYGS
jgi:preprotein translocase subunit SecE